MEAECQLENIAEVLGLRGSPPDVVLDEVEELRDEVLRFQGALKKIAFLGTTGSMADPDTDGSFARSQLNRAISIAARTLGHNEED